MDQISQPTPDFICHDMPSSIVSLCTPLEEVVASLWSQILHVTPIGIHDNFFTLGGNSLLAMQINVQLAKTLQVNLPLRSFFESPTVSQLAELIAQQQAGGSLAPPIVPCLSARHWRPDNTYIFPVTSAQKALWFIDQISEGNTAYNLPATLHIHKLLYKEALKKSLDVLVQRHETLRTTFIVVDEQPVQCISSQLDIPLTITDLQHLSLSAKNATVLQMATQALQYHFDLAQGPLLRAILFSLAPTEHILVLITHHIISDGWSINLLLQELVTLYEAFSTERQEPGEAQILLPELPLQFGDFAVWQREHLQAAFLHEHLSYWRQHLANVPKLLNLPTDRPHTNLPTYKGAMYTFTLPLELSSALKTLSLQENVTLYITLVTAFMILLKRYSDQDDFVLGTNTANRTFSETQSLFGYFTNTLVLRADLSGDPTVHILLARIREIVLAADAHQQVPFDILLRELHPDCPIGQNPLFQVFVTLDPPFPELALGYDSTRLELATGMAKFDLSLELSDCASGIVGHLEYNTDLFDTSTIVRMADHWETLLGSMVNNPALCLSRLAIMTEAERQQILFTYNNTHTMYPNPHTLVELFEKQVARTPDAIAVIYEWHHVSYHELNRQSNQLARMLLRQGITPETRVGVYLPRTPNLVIALLAVLKSSGAYVPLDTLLPSDRVAFMVYDARASLVITEEALAPIIQEKSIISLSLDLVQKALKQENDENLLLPISPEQLAYVLYTSGSTGRPKGVMGTHLSMTNRLHWMWQRFPFAAGEVCCQRTSQSFVDAIPELFTPLLAGIPTVLISDEQSHDLIQLLDMLAYHQVSRLVLVPSLLRILLNVEIKLGEYVPHLQWWICSGEAVPIDVWQRFQEELRDRQIINLYGSSEVASDATFYQGQFQEENIPSGHPLGNVSIYVLDTYLQPVPIGVVGEIYVGGLGLARGYVDQADKTADAFIPDAWSGEAGRRLYKMGDLGRYRSDVVLEYIGRRDFQVKLRGFRIELGEIEAVLSHHTKVKEVVVIARKDASEQKYLAAYVVSQNIHAAPEVSHLLGYLKRKLPEYMIPSAFVFMEMFPHTISGKVDRKNLPVPTQRGIHHTKGITAPNTSTEKMLVGLWSEALHIKQIGIHDNFFYDLRCDSLQCLQIVARARQAGLYFTTKQLFQYPTIAELASMIEAEKSNEQGSRNISHFQQPEHRSIENDQIPHDLNTHLCLPPSLVGSNLSGIKHPFFCVHAISGEVAALAKLASAIGSDQPFYIFRAAGLDGECDPFTNIEEIATYYIKAMRTVDPYGPYLIGGWSFGGLVAFEMALQLQQQGVKVALLALIDTFPPVPDREPPKTEHFTMVAPYVRGIALRYQLKEPDFFLLEEEDLQKMTQEEQLQYMMHAASLAGADWLPSDPRLLEAYLQVVKSNELAAYYYRPQDVLHHQLTYFKATNRREPDPIIDDVEIWQRFTSSPVVVQDIAATHEDIVHEPNALAMLVKKMRSYFDLLN